MEDRGIFLKSLYYVYSVLSACMTAGQKRTPDLITDGCELAMWVLGIKLRNSGRAASALDH